MRDHRKKIGILFLWLTILLVACGEGGAKEPSSPSSFSTPTASAVFQREIALYSAVGLEEGESLRILEVAPNKLLYEVSSPRPFDTMKMEGILSRTSRVGVYLLEEETILEEVELEGDYYISSGTIQGDHFLILGILLDEADDHYQVLESGADMLVTRHEGTTIPYFTQWPELASWKGGAEALLWIPIEGEDGTPQAKAFMINDQQETEREIPFQGRLLSGNDLQICSDTLLTFWEIQEKGRFAAWNLGENTQLLPLPEGKKILDYVLTQEGVVASLQTDDLHAELGFLPFSNAKDGFAQPAIPLFRMTSRTDQSIFCVSGSFELYEILLAADGFELRQVDLSPWTASSNPGPVFIHSTGNGAVLVHLEEEEKVLLFA